MNGNDPAGVPAGECMYCHDGTKCISETIDASHYRETCPRCGDTGIWELITSDNIDRITSQMNQDIGDDMAHQLNVPRSAIPMQLVKKVTPRGSVE